MLPSTLFLCLCFTLYSSSISKYKPPGLISKGRSVFCITPFGGGCLGGFYFEGLTHGGVYFRNFAVYLKKSLHGDLDSFLFRSQKVK